MNNMEIGNRIKQRRKELGLTQVQIHEATGISSGNLSLIENGKSLPSSSALVNLSNLLQCSIDYLLKGNSLNLEISGLSNFKEIGDVSDIELSLIKLFRQLDQGDQEEIIDVMELKIKRKDGRRKSSNSVDKTDIGIA